MAAGLRLEISQSQQLVMTPQLQQAIKLLQMSNIELCDFVANEVERNPLLVLDPSQEAKAPAPNEAAPAVDERVTAEGDHSLSAETFDTGRENLHDVAPGDGYGSGQSEWARAGTGRSNSFDGPAREIDASLSEAPTLRAHLHAQLGQTRVSEVIRQTARLIVEDLDEHGYYRDDLQGLADRLGASLDLVEDALALVQSLDPTGVGARSLAECFRLQLVERGTLRPQMKQLLDRLELLERHPPSVVAAKCGVSSNSLASLLSELRTLKPHPGEAFAQTPTQPISPDVLLRRTNWGGWNVELNPETLPKVLIDRRYATQLRAGGDEVKTFEADCRNSANWLIRSLDQRARTILRVASEIVLRQEAFFTHGISGMQPLTLKTVADALDIHESTASRVTANKYMATERGIFELKYFFTNAVGTGDGVSAEAVRHRVKALIDAEDPGNILSDDAIVDILQKDGIEIARRTVAKYRKSLKIPSSVERRRRKALQSA